MKKAIQLSSTIAVIVASPLAAADTVFGIYAGYGNWQTEYEGYAADSGQNEVNFDDLGFDEKDSDFYYVAIEHPIPVIPNIKLQSTDISDNAVGSISLSTTIDDIDFSADEDVATDFDLSHTDVTLYYELLDNWLNLDFGITGRIFDGHIDVKSIDNPGNDAFLDLDATVPLLYLKGQFDLPLTGLYGAITGNWISYDDSTVSDYSAALGWASDGWLMDIGIEFGVRTFTLEIEDVSDVDADIEFSGSYGMLTVHF